MSDEMDEIARELYPMYTKTKRDEMTFGFLPGFIPADIVPDMAGSAAFYTPYEIYKKCLEMDAGFTGLRRSTIDKTHSVRQAILYTMVIRDIDTERPLFAVYKRSSGSDERLEGNYSLGFGGHVETCDLMDHFDGLSGEVAEGCISSLNSIVASGIREVNEEVRLYDVNDPLRLTDPVKDIAPIGFLSDIDPDNPDHVGNTHFCMIGIVSVDATTVFEVTDPKYANIGWMDAGALKTYIKRFEPWSRILVERMDEVIQLLQDEVEVEASDPAERVLSVKRIL